MKRNLFDLIKGGLLTILCISLLAGCSNYAKPNSTGTNTNNDSNNNGQSENYSSSKLEKNVTSSGAMTEHGELVVFVKNDNKVPVDMEIEVEFYDANGTIAGSDSEELEAVGSKSEIAVQMWNTPENFDNYKIYVDVEQTEEITYYNQVEVTHNNNGKEIAVQVKNNSQDVIDHITVAVVYYQEDKVVGIDDDIETDIKSGRSANFNLDFPYDKEYEDVKFDDYKVFVNEAFSYNV